MLSLIFGCVLAWFAGRSVHTPNIPGYRLKSTEEARFVGSNVRRYNLGENASYAVHPELAGLYRVFMFVVIFVTILLPIIVATTFDPFFAVVCLLSADVIMFNLERWLNATFWNTEWQARFSNGRSFPNKIDNG